MTQLSPQSVAGRRRVGYAGIWFIAGVAACSLAALAALAAVAASGVLTAGIGLTLSLLPIPALLAGAIYLDRLEPEPAAALVLIFGCGVAAAALIGLVDTLTGADLITTPALRTGGFAAAPAGLVIGIAVLEETLKAAALIGLLLRRPQEIDGVHDGLVYGAMVGLGFALIENLFYYSQAAHFGFRGVATTFLLRGVVSPLWQLLFSSLVGAGVAAAARFGLRRGLWAVAAGWAGAVILHALWNGALGTGVGLLALTYVLFAVVLVILLVAVVVDRRRIISLIPRYLPEHKADGVATDMDIAMLASMADRRQARQWARLHGGLAGLRAMSEYQLGATEAGLLHRRSARGLISDEVFAAERDMLLADMRSAIATLVARLNLMGRLNPASHPPWSSLDGSCFSQTRRPAAPPPPPEATAAPGAPAEHTAAAAGAGAGVASPEQPPAGAEAGEAQ